MLRSMTSELEVVPRSAPVPLADPADLLRAIVAGRPPVSHWEDLGAWLHERGESNGLIEATGTWIVSRRTGSEHTRNAYAADLSRWFTWCSARGSHPVTARNMDADLYAAACREAGLSPATAGRRLATASSWYKYAIRAGVATVNPLDGMERPQSPAISSTRGMSQRELASLLSHAKAYRPVHMPPEQAAVVAKRAYALLMTLAATASRIGAILAADVADLGYDSGYRVLDLTVKGDKRQRFVLPPATIAAIEDYLDGRTEGPLFASSTGRRMDEPRVYRLIQRIAARAGIPQAAQLSPHSMRHTVATILLRNEEPLHIVQGLLSHATPQTTQRYNLAREALDSSPASHMGELIATEMRLLESEGE